MENLSLVLDLVSILVWAFVLYRGFRMADIGYGKRFTSVYPSLVGSIGIFLLLGIFEFVHFTFVVSGRGAASETFVLGMKSMQLGAGLLLARATHQIYDINFATAGFLGDEK